MTTDQLRYLLLQVRKPTDPMRFQEIRCFGRALGCHHEQIQVQSLLEGVPDRQQLSQVDIVLIGGSGDYSVVEGAEWLPSALQGMRDLCAMKKPTFGSCWGFQAMAMALGGKVITDAERREVGIFEIALTESGRDDPLLGPIGPKFQAFEGHQDHVVALPANTRLLATTQPDIYQAFRVREAPIYCTQFHPELDADSFSERLAQYPEYVKKVGGESALGSAAMLEQTKPASTLLRRFAESVGAVKT